MPPELTFMPWPRVFPRRALVSTGVDNLLFGAAAEASSCAPQRRAMLRLFDNLRATNSPRRRRRRTFFLRVGEGPIRPSNNNPSCPGLVRAILPRVEGLPQKQTLDAGQNTLYVVLPARPRLLIPGHRRMETIA